MIRSIVNIRKVKFLNASNDSNKIWLENVFQLFDFCPNTKRFSTQYHKSHSSLEKKTLPLALARLRLARVLSSSSLVEVEV